MMPIIHGIVAQRGLGPVTVVREAFGEQPLTSSFTKTVTVSFASAAKEDEVLLFFYTRASYNSPGTIIIPSGLELKSNMGGIPNPFLYSYSNAIVYSKSAGSSEPTDYTFSYNSSGNGYLYVKGYILSGADLKGFSTAMRTTQSNITSQIIPASAISVSKNDLTFVFHLKQNTGTINSISNGYSNRSTMFANHANVWRKSQTADDASHNTTISWNGSTSSAGIMVNVPALT